MNIDISVILELVSDQHCGVHTDPKCDPGSHTYTQVFNQLWAIDANWRHIRNVRYRRLTPNGVKAVFFAFFVHSARLLRSTSGLWLAADRRY